MDSGTRFGRFAEDDLHILSWCSRIPVFLWKRFPAPFLAHVTDLLDLIETSEEWPKELIQAYVTMITKASGGTRPQDQCPSTVLDVVYGI